MASVFRPSDGTAHECSTSSDEISIRIGTSIGKIEDWYFYWYLLNLGCICCMWGIHRDSSKCAYILHCIDFPHVLFTWTPSCSTSSNCKWFPCSLS
jgi:hypothetical protein